MGGCGGEADAGSASKGPRVIQPGLPGEAATEAAPGTVVPRAEWNHTDVSFMQMMIPHHAQAVEMAKLAPARASDDRVRRFAERVRAAQAPEILTMAAWLEERGLEVPAAGDDASSFDHGKHGHTAMAGMLTPAQLEELRGARGSRFDRLFLRGMISHHQGAVAMAEQVAPTVGDVLVSELTADVGASQSAEINRMRDLLAQL